MSERSVESLYDAIEEAMDNNTDTRFVVLAIVSHLGITEKMVAGMQVCQCSCAICTEWRGATKKPADALSLLLAAAETSE